MKARDLKSQLVRGSFGGLALKIIGTTLSFVVGLTLARTLGAHNYGLFSFAVAVTSIIAVPSQLGFPNLIVRETAKGKAKKHWRLLKGLWRWTGIAVCVSSFIIASVCLVVILLLQDYFNADQWVVLLVALALIPLVALGNTTAAALKGLGRVVVGQLSEQIIRPFLFLLLIALNMFILGEHTATKAMGLNVLSTFITLIISCYLLLKFQPKQLKITHHHRYRPKEWIGSAVPLGILTGLQLINNQTDLIMIGVLSSSENVGIYKVATSAVALITFGLGVINAVVAPHFARLYALDDMNRLQKVVTVSAQASFALALPLALPFFIWGRELLTFIFGAQYSAGHIALSILLTGQLFNISLGLTSSLLMMTGKERVIVPSLVITVALNALLNIALIPRFGVEGAAISTVVALLIWKIYVTILVKSKLDISTPIISSLVLSKKFSR